MQSTLEALVEGYTFDTENKYFKFEFGDGYELSFEPLLFEGQMYVGLYKDGELLTNKVVVKAGKS